MKNEKEKRPSSSEIYLDFINMNYDAIRSCLKCLIFYFSDNFENQKKELLKLEPKGMLDTSITKKIIELSKIEKIKSEESMNEEINSDKNENYFEKINPKDTNEIKKKKLRLLRYDEDVLKI